MLSDGVARFTGGPVSRRAYLQTVATDWATRSFVAEAVFRIPDADAWSIPLFGLSTGRIVPTEYDAPIDGPHLLVLVRADQRSIATYDNIRTLLRPDRGVGTIRAARPPAPGVHRIVMSWDAAARRATIQWDAGNDGSIEGESIIDGSDNAFDGDNARIVFGGGGGLELDSLTVRPIEPEGATDSDTNSRDLPGETADRPEGSSDADGPLEKK